MKPDRAATHNSLGWALQEEGRLAEAAEHYHTALRLDPDLGGAQLNIGGVHEELGELTEAESAFRAALRIQPRFALAHARLAMLLRGKLPDADFTALEQRLADPKVSGEPRAALLFGLAQILDGRGEYARAADCLREAPRRSAVRWQRGGDGGKGGSSAARRVRGLSGWPRSAWKGGICQAPVCQVGGWPPEGGKGVNWL